MSVVVWRGNENFLRFLENVMGESLVYKTEKLEDALSYALENKSQALFLLPDYDNSENVIEEFEDGHIKTITQIIASGNTKIYIENYPSYDARDYYIFGLQSRAFQATLGRNSVRLQGELKEALGFELLQKRNGIFLQNEKHYEQEISILAEIRNCLGVHDVIAEDEKYVGIALSKTARNVFTAMVDFTNFDSYFTLPYKHWGEFYAELFSDVLSVEKQKVKDAFFKTFNRIKTEKPAGFVYKEEDVKEALEESVKKAVLWHINSGLMPKNDGSGGVYEMIRSFDLKAAKNIRGDSSLFTAALFSLAGKYFGKPEWLKVSENIMEETLIRRDIQIREGINKGLLKWFAGVEEFGTHIIYTSDTARGGNCLFGIYKATGDEKLKNRILMMGEAFLRWFSEKPLLATGWFNYDETDLERIQEREKTSAPEFYEAIMIFMRNVYSITGDERYKNQILKTADEMAKIYPNYGIGASHSKNFTLSRVLGVFAAAQSIESGSWTKRIDEILNYFADLQHPCGGYADGKAYFDNKSLGRDMEFAIGFGPEHGNICDLMYCQNTMVYTLNILNKCETEGFNKALVKEMLKKTVGFLLNTQIVSEDLKLSGGWMRAYDMDLDEYYGCDKDFAWGAYSILTGWVTGAIPLTFLDMLGMETMY